MIYVAKRLNNTRVHSNQGIWWLLAISAGLILTTESVVIGAGLFAVVATVTASAITPLATLVILLILAPMRTLILTEANTQLPIDIGQLLLIGLFGFWLGTIIIRKHTIMSSLRWSPVYIPLLIFVVVISISAFGSLSLGVWFNEWLKWIQILILVTTIVSFVRGEQWIWLIFGMIVAGTSNALIGIYEFFGGSGALHLLINNRFFRAFGTFGQPNPFGAFMGMLAPLGIMLTIGYTLRLFHKSRTGQRIVYTDFISTIFFALSTGVIILGLVVSWSRGAWLGFIASSFIILILLPQKLWQSVLLATGMITVGLLIATSSFIPTSIVSRIQSSTQEIFNIHDVRGVEITSENFAVLERLAHWQAALNMATNKPWLGVGIGNYEVAYDNYRLLNWPEPLGHAHNYYLNVLAETGVIGFMAYGILWIWMLRLLWQARQHPDHLARAVTIGIMGALTHILIHSLTDNLFVNNLFLHIGVLFGILALLHRQVYNGVKLKS